MIPLSRAVANELTLLACLVCFAVTDICAPPCQEVFCTDASLQKGAICSAKVSCDFSRFLWRVTRSKGAYHRLLTPIESIAKRLGIHEEKPASISSGPDRPLAFHYDFLEVFSGAAKVTAALDSLGFVTGPPIDISISEEYNMEFAHVLSWLSHMVSSHQLASFIVEPPCTPLRSKFCPFGFDVRHAQTANGNLLAHRALQLLSVGWKNYVPGLLEKPFSSLLKHIPSYKHLLSKQHVNQCRTDSCMFGSIHMKSFRFVLGPLGFGSPVSEV